MLDDAVSYYHQLLADEELGESSLRTLDQGLEEAKLIFGGRDSRRIFAHTSSLKKIGIALLRFAKPFGAQSKKLKMQPLKMNSC